MENVSTVSRKHKTLLSIIATLLLSLCVFVRAPTTVNAESSQIVSNSSFGILPIPDLQVNGSPVSSNSVMAFFTMAEYPNDIMLLRNASPSTNTRASYNSVRLAQYLQGGTLSKFSNWEYNEYYRTGDGSSFVYYLVGTASPVTIGVTWTLYIKTEYVTRATFSNYIYNQIYNAEYMSNGGSLYYHFYDSATRQRSMILEITPTNTQNTFATASTRYLNPFTSILTDENGAYDTGYDVGYKDGSIAQLDSLTPFGIVSSAITSFLGINLFGGLTIGTLLTVAFGFIFIGILMKVFLGG